VGGAGRLSSGAMAPKGSNGPGRAQRKGTSAAGRTTVKAGRVGRYTAPEVSGKYTPPIPRTVRKSPPWFGPLVLTLLVAGVLLILLNYLSILPGSVSAWYLVAGLVVIFGGFVLATRYH
jgi:hypothetical protein